MAEFSVIKTNTPFVDPYVGESPMWFGILSPVIIQLQRTDIANWTAATRTAVSQLLETDWGWVVGTNVALIFSDGTRLVDTVASITEGSGNTVLTFTNYNSFAEGSSYVINLDYTGYHGDLRMKCYRAKPALAGLGDGVERWEDTVRLTFSPSGQAFFDVAEWYRNRMDSHPEWFTNTTFTTLSQILSYDEFFNLSLDIKAVSNEYESSDYGWQGIAEDSAGMWFVNAKEPIFQGFDITGGSGFTLSQPRLWQVAINPYTGAEEKSGGPNWPVGAVPLLKWRPGGFVRWMASFINCDVPNFELLVGKIADFSNYVLEAGVTHISGVMNFTEAQVDAEPFAVMQSSTEFASSHDDTFQQKRLDIRKCDCPTGGVAWKYNGGLYWFEFEIQEADAMEVERGKTYAAFSKLENTSNFGLPSNVAQAPATYRRLPANEARTLSIVERNLSGANLLYLQTLLSADQVWFVNLLPDSTLGTVGEAWLPATVEFGETLPRTNPHDLYTISYKIRIQL